MARNGADVLGKKNSKLEAFLKRNLDVDTFERIRAHEPCIVCSEKEDKAFKFVLLSDEWIYLTENPPKKIYETVYLRDVISVDLVNEYPEFLNGEQKENTLHIGIRYWTDQPAKGKRKRSLPVSTVSAPNTPRSARSLTGGITSRSDSGSTSRLASKRLSVAQLTPRQSYEARTQSDTRLSTGKHPDMCPSVGKRPSAGTKQQQQLQCENRSPSDGIKSVSLSATNLATTLLNRYSSVRFDEVRQLPRRLPSPADAWDENGELLDRRNREPLKLGYGGAGELRLQLEKLEDNVFDDEEDENKQSTVQVPRLNLEECNRANEDGLLPLKNEKIEDNEQPRLRVAMLHLYVLDYSSPLLMLTRNAWNSCLIRGTLEEDASYLEKTCGYATRPSKAVSTKFDQLFSQLRQELISSENSLEDEFRLLCEMKSAAERNSAIKRFFWKTPDLFSFIVKQLQCYLPKSAVLTSGDCSDESKLQRADELELVVLLVETLQVMLRETDNLPSRLDTLKAGNGKATLDLIVILTCDPQVPGSPSAARCMSRGTATQWMTSADVELSKLQQEFNNGATAVLYELILIAHQANWGDNNGSFFNIAWLIKILEELNTTEGFVKRLIVEAMRLISPSRSDELLPCQAVLLYQQFHVLQTVVTYSTHMALYIRNNFFEEFKYYIQAPVILQKLPERYLLRLYVIRLMEQVMTIILQRSVTLLPPSQSDTNMITAHLTTNLQL